MLRSFIAQFVATGAVIVALCGGFTACASPDELTPRRAQAVTTRTADLNRHQAAKVAAAREKVRFVGESHRAAMNVVFQEALARRSTRTPMPRIGSQEYCRLLEKAAKAAIRVINDARSAPRSGSEQSRELQSIPELARCNEGVADLPAGHLASWQEIDGLGLEVTGAYESYLGLMETQVQASDWTVAGVGAATNDVLATAVAEGIPQGDLLALTAFADFSEASAVEWNSAQWGPVVGNGSTCTGSRCLMSFFRRSSFSGNVGKIVSADVTGCLSSVKSWSALKLLLYAPAWEALAGQCGVRGAIGSAIAVIALM